MDRAALDEYLRKFHARDYDAILDYYADDLRVGFAGYVFTTKDQVRKFYKFFHSYVTETIQLDRFASGGDLVAIEARVKLECFKDLTQDALNAQGLDRIVSLSAGQTVTIPQFIHYTITDGKFTKVECVVSAPPY